MTGLAELAVETPTAEPKVRFQPKMFQFASGSDFQSRAVQSFTGTDRLGASFSIRNEFGLGEQRR
jgi:hypothetical protein